MRPPDRARSARPRWLGLSLSALALLLALALWPGLGCSRETRKVARVQVREPVLTGGGASAPRALSERVLEEVRFDEGLEGWELRGGEADGAWPLLSGPAAGTVLRPADTRTPAERERGAPVPGLALLGEGLALDADEVTSLVFRAAFSGAGRARVYFRRAAADGQASAFRAADFVEIPVRPSRAPEDWVFDMRSHPGWRGRIDGLRFHPAAREAGVLLESVRAVDRDLIAGPSAVELDGELVDAGLISLGYEDPNDPHEARYEARRSYPALAGEDLYLAFALEPGSVVSFSFALPPDVERLKGPVTFELILLEDARANGVAGPRTGAGGAGAGELGSLDLPASAARGRKIFERTLAPERDAERWFAEHVELPDGEGETALLYLRAEGGRPPGRVNGLWGPVEIAPADPADGPPSVLLITADTLRADCLGAYGAENAHTPVLDALADRGVVFTDTFSACNATSPAHATILTGLYPKDHRVLGNDYLMPPQVPTLAEAMKASGRTTIANVAVRHLNSTVSGMGQGFDVYLDTPPANGVAGRLPYRSASESHRALFDVLGGIGPAPFFAWVHYYDPHTPYLPEREFAELHWKEGAPSADEPDTLAGRLAAEWAARDARRARVRGPDGRTRVLEGAELTQLFLRKNPHLAFLGRSREPAYQEAMYRAEISQLDRDIGRLFERLDELGRLDGTIVVFTADHGESLGERGIWYSHQGIYTNTLHVPLVFAGPGVPAGERVARPVATVDIVPTLAELLDLSCADGLPGTSLVEAMAAPEAPGERRTRWFQYGQNHETGFRTEQLHFLLSNRNHARGTFDQLVPEGAVELYDLRADPSEEHDVSAERGSDAERATERVHEWLDEHTVFAETQRAELSSEDRAALEDLGYAGDE